MRALLLTALLFVSPALGQECTGPYSAPGFGTILFGDVNAAINIDVTVTLAGQKPEACEKTDGDEYGGYIECPSGLVIDYENAKQGDGFTALGLLWSRNCT